MIEVESPFTTNPGMAPIIGLNTQHLLELDADGIPWDERIHASSKAKVAGGTWRTKRGVDEAVYFQVKTELKAKYAGAVQQVEQTVQTPPTANMGVPTQNVIQMPPQTQAAPVMPPQLPKLGAGHTVETFTSNFALVMANLITEGKITQEYANNLKGHYGVAELWELNNEDKAGLFEFFAANGIIQKV
jgi:hypothetical protein